MTETATGTGALTASLILFSYFQLLDLLTTVGFLMHRTQQPQILSSGNQRVHFGSLVAMIAAKMALADAQ